MLPDRNFSSVRILRKNLPLGQNRRRQADGMKTELRRVQSGA